jgi:hypothetical protein
MVILAGFAAIGFIMRVTMQAKKHMIKVCGRLMAFIALRPLFKIGMCT